MYVHVYKYVYVYIYVHSHLVVATPILVELFLGYLWGFMVVRLWGRPMDVYGYELTGLGLWVSFYGHVHGIWRADDCVSMVYLGRNIHPILPKMPTITLEHVRTPETFRTRKNWLDFSPVWGENTEKKGFAWRPTEQANIRCNFTSDTIWKENWNLSYNLV
jgi:hypothetical protein